MPIILNNLEIGDLDVRQVNAALIQAEEEKHFGIDFVRTNHIGIFFLPDDVLDKMRVHLNKPMVACYREKFKRAEKDKVTFLKSECKTAINAPDFDKHTYLSTHISDHKDLEKSINCPTYMEVLEEISNPYYKDDVRSGQQVNPVYLFGGSVRDFITNHYKTDQIDDIDISYVSSFDDIEKYYLNIRRCYLAGTFNKARPPPYIKIGNEETNEHIEGKQVINFTTNSLESRCNSLYLHIPNEACQYWYIVDVFNGKGIREAKEKIYHAPVYNSDSDDEWNKWVSNSAQKKSFFRMIKFHLRGYRIDKKTAKTIIDYFLKNYNKTDRKRQPIIKVSQIWEKEKDKKNADESQYFITDFKQLIMETYLNDQKIDHDIEDPPYLVSSGANLYDKIYNSVINILTTYFTFITLINISPDPEHIIYVILTMKQAEGIKINEKIETLKEQIKSETTKIITNEPNCNCPEDKEKLLECMTCSKRANEIAIYKLKIYSYELSQEMLDEYPRYYLILHHYITQQTLESIETINKSILEAAKRSDTEYKKREAARAARAARAANASAAVNAREAKAPEK